MKLALLAIAAGATTARAEPWTVEVRGGMELAPLAADDVFERVGAAATYTWHDRWMIGGAIGFAIDPSTSMSLPSGANIRTYLAELAVRLQPASKLGVELGWRVGRAGIDLGFAYVHATDLEPVVVLAVPVGKTLELHIEPLVLDLYRSSTWQMTVGASVGVAWRP